ncbi:MAG TPA: peptidylprolyl isomerase [Candidatus Absconditabacterales bacterium]|nr:peptidylprolyl isomerase [Candidatus Absconditabacterales bacterium]HRU49887.1 peptidylprolyl isomerase [Candidatus Absconditabacterales bacterium]
MKKFKVNNGIIKKLLILLVGIAIIVLFCVLFCKNDVMVCDSVKDYLASADFKGKGAQIKKGDEIVVDYIGRLKDGEVFDTSIEQVAKGCDKYNEARDYSQGLGFIVGAGQMIPGFDRAVEGMKVGQTKTVEISPSDAYGEIDESLLISVKKSQLQLPDQYKEGDVLYAPNGQSIKIHKVTKNEITLDTNHELAGKTLIFDITIKEIK